MNLVELKTILEATGIPVAFFDFIESDNEPLPVPPYICYLPTFSSNFMADNTVHKKIENVQIELYTNRKDLEIENILETVLNDNEIPFQTSEIFIDDEQIYQKIYEVRLL